MPKYEHIRAEFIEISRDEFASILVIEEFETHLCFLVTIAIDEDIEEGEEIIKSNDGAINYDFEKTITKEGGM